MSSAPVFRTASAEDAAAICKIYAPIVLETAISFEEIPPDQREMAERIARVLENYPWIVAVLDGAVVGYAYGTAHRPRPAYRWTVETSVYVAPAGQRHGVGRQLYRKVLDRLAAQGYRQAMAAIALPNARSVAFHEALGFVHRGTLHSVGYKLGRWHDLGWWQCDLGGGDQAPIQPEPPHDISI